MIAFTLEAGKQVRELRRHDEDRRRIEAIRGLSTYTTELVNVLNVLGRLVALEPKQADLLERVCAGATISGDDRKAAIAAVPTPPGQKAWLLWR